MSTKKKKPFLSGIPPWGLAGIALIAPIIFMIILVFLADLMRIDENIADPFFYIFTSLFIAVCCFYIIRHYPKSIWYVPVICNVAGIVSAIIEPNFWISSLWLFIGSGWVLSIIASIIGYKVGTIKIQQL
jgi:hypothetical protein